MKEVEAMKAPILKTVKLPNGETLAYREKKGGDKTLVLLHGNLSSSVNWDLLFEHLNDEFTLYALDLRGCGDSTHSEPATSVEDFAKDVKEFADALSLKRFHLSGWSFGAAVAMRMAIDFPEYVKRLVLLSSASVQGHPIRKRRLFGLVRSKDYIESLEGMESFVKPLKKIQGKTNPITLKRVLNTTFYTKDKPHDRRYENYIEALKKQQNIAEIHYALSRFNISNQHNGLVQGTDEAAKIHQPTLFIHGQSDKVVPPSIAHENQKAIGENAKVEILKLSGHSPLVDEIRNVRDLYNDFLR